MSRIVKILITAVLVLLEPGAMALAAEVNRVVPDQAVAVGDTFSVDIAFSPDTGEELAGGVIDLGYDDTKVEVRKVVIHPRWDFKPDPGSKSGSGLWKAIGFDAFANPPGAGTAPIATITLEALAAGTSPLAIMASSTFFSAALKLSPTVTEASVRVNTPPVAEDLALTTDEDTAVAAMLACTDGDGDALSYVVVSNPVKGALSGAPPHLIYTPAANVNGSDTFTFRASDGKNDSDIATATITVSPVNDAPVVAAIADQTIPEGGGFAVIALDDYVHDVETADADLSWTASGNAQLSVSIVDRVAAIAPPDAHWSGSETITFTVADADGALAAEAATFTVTPVDDEPLVEMGDINNDLTVDLSDAVLILQVVSGIDPASPVYRQADVNGDGAIGIEEAIYILQTVSELRQ